MNQKKSSFCTEKTEKDVKKKNRDALPLRIVASGRMTAGNMNLKANGSSQYVSSILMWSYH